MSCSICMQFSAHLAIVSLAAMHCNLMLRSTRNQANLYTRKHPFTAPHRVATVALQLDDRARIQRACNACMNERHACISTPQLSTAVEEGPGERRAQPEDTKQTRLQTC